MLMFKALHLIAMVAWFSGLFYLPRLFVYHADALDEISITRFKIMERRLYYGIIWPSSVLTTIFGLILLCRYYPLYLHMMFMHAKIGFIVLLWVYQLACGHYLKKFAVNANNKRAAYYRIFNEVPTIFLIAIVFLIVLKPM